LDPGSKEPRRLSGWPHSAARGYPPDFGKPGLLFLSFPDWRRGPAGACRQARAIDEAAAN